MNQLISPELQSKVVGVEGSMEALVLRALFKEAKAREEKCQHHPEEDVYDSRGDDIKGE